MDDISGGKSGFGANGPAGNNCYDRGASRQAVRTSGIAAPFGILCIIRRLVSPPKFAETREFDAWILTIFFSNG